MSGEHSATFHDARSRPPESLLGAVFLSRLSLRDFRNLGVQELVIPREGVAILGDNAQGKSNLLEAIYYLETLRSFRGAKDAQLVAFGRSVFRVEADISSGQAPRPMSPAQTMEPGQPGQPGQPGLPAPAVAEVKSGETVECTPISAAFDRVTKEKRVTVAGDQKKTLTAGLGHIGAVIFSPDDIRMVNGPPAERRRFLDIVLSLNEAGYMQALQRYRRALAQRNAALKAGASGGALEGWNRALAEHGGLLMQGRSKWVGDNSAGFTGHYEAIAGIETATMSYRPSVPLAPGEETEERLLAAIREAESRDLRLRTTTVGPHRDELSMAMSEEGLDLRDFGSGGQRRTAALALRLIEADTIAGARGVEPVILMDDAFAELDQVRSERLMARIEAGLVGQVILTAPKESDVRVRRDVLPRWRISAGRIAA